MRITSARAALSLITAFLISMISPVSANAQSQDEAYQGEDGGVRLRGASI